MFKNRFLLKFPREYLMIAVLTISSGSAMLLLCLRIVFTSELTYIFLAWNLFLAWIPFLCAEKMERSFNRKRIKFSILLLLIWLFFFPNSPYIITDLIHLKARQNCPLWFDSILILSFAWNGLMVGFISLMKIQALLKAGTGYVLSWVIAISLLVLSSFGVYLGRFLRFNSWDVMFQPYTIFSEITDRLFHPFHHLQTMAVTIVFSFFLVSAYSVINVIGMKGDAPGDKIIRPSSHFV